MAVVSYRLHCTDCSNEEFIRRDRLDSSPWKAHSVAANSGLCPACNEAVDLSEIDDDDSYEQEIALEELDHIGKKAAQNLREAEYDTVERIAAASDEEMLDVSWVGEKGLLSLKEAAKQLEPQQRWDK